MLIHLNTIKFKAQLSLTTPEVQLGLIKTKLSYTKDKLSQSFQLSNNFVS